MRLKLIPVVWMSLGLTCIFYMSVFAETLKLSPSAQQPVLPKSNGKGGFIAPVSPAEPVKLKTEKHGAIESNLFRQLLPQRYPEYESKTRSVRSSLKQASAYLNSLNGKPVSIQRLSAFSAEIWLDWQQLERISKPDEREYRTYQLIQETVTTLRSLSLFWVASEKTRRLFRGTAEAEAMDRTLIEDKLKHIEKALNELEQFELLKAELNSELP